MRAFALVVLLPVVATSQVTVQYGVVHDDLATGHHQIYADQTAQIADMRKQSGYRHGGYVYSSTSQYGTNSGQGATITQGTYFGGGVSCIHIGFGTTCQNTNPK